MKKLLTKNLTNILLTTLIFAFVFSYGNYWADSVGVNTIGYLNLTGDQDGEEFGYPVRFIGDVNNDGTEDIAIGSLGYDVGGSEDSGRVTIISGVDGVTIRTHTQPGGTASASAFFGAALVSMGDVNGDNFDDYAIMDPRHSNGEGGAILNERGRVIAYSGQDGSVLWTYFGTSDFQFQFGNALMVSARDFSSDSIRDLAVGAPGMSVNDARAGAILILNATNGALITQYDGTGINQFVGSSFDTGSDINGDSVEDFVIGEPFTSGVETWEGAARVISGVNLASPTTIYTQAGVSGQRFGFFGLFVQFLGDANNGGRDDFAVSSRETAGGFRRAGVLRIFAGEDNALINQFDGTQQNALFGSSLANAGDINNDGYADLVTAALAVSNGAGRADIYQNKGAIRWERLPGGAAGEAFGADIDAGKDITGDGVPDILLGSTGGQSGPIFPGRARVAATDITHVQKDSNIEVHPDLNNQETSITLPSVSTAGNITYDSTPVSGANFQTKQAGNSQQWSITTDAVFSGTATICLKYDEVQYTNEANIDIQYREGGAGGFSTVTTSLDTVNNIVCGGTLTLQ